MAHRKRILVADDDPELLDLLTTDLASQGYEILSATNGKDALKIALAEKLHLVLLDVMMPYVDGYHVAYEITNKLGSTAPLILIMTSRDTKSEKGVALMSGALDAIQKPFALESLRENIRTILAKV